MPGIIFILFFFKDLSILGNMQDAILLTIAVVQVPNHRPSVVILAVSVN